MSGARCLAAPSSFASEHLAAVQSSCKPCQFCRRLDALAQSCNWCIFFFAAAHMPCKAMSRDILRSDPPPPPLGRGARPNPFIPDRATSLLLLCNTLSRSGDVGQSPPAYCNWAGQPRNFLSRNLSCRLRICMLQRTAAARHHGRDSRWGMAAGTSCRSPPSRRAAGASNCTLMVSLSDKSAPTIPMLVRLQQPCSSMSLQLRKELFSWGPLIHDVAEDFQAIGTKSATHPSS